MARLPVEQLLDNNSMKELFWENRELIDSRITQITRLSIKKIKFYNESDFQHAVVQYDLHFIDAVGWQQYVKMYASAHSDGSRLRSYNFMQHVHSHGFNLHNYYSSTKPLFYNKALKASFHQELLGENILYIVENYPDLLPEATKQSAHCLALFHDLPIPEKPKVSPYPITPIQLDPSGIMKHKSAVARGNKEFIKHAYKQLKKYRKKHKERFMNSIFGHGDFHLENIIIGTDFKHHPIPFDKIGIIDFTDVCRSDRGIDIGSFTQKLFFATTYKLNYSHLEADDLVKIFIHEYSQTARVQITEDMMEQIYFWQTWNALRVLVNYLLFHTKHEARKQLRAFISKRLEHLAHN